MSLFVVRYGELGLKSPKVKKRFQRALKRNIEDAFLKRETQCISAMDWGRVYLHTDDDEMANEILSKTFGVTSFSKVVETTSDLQDICKTAAEYSSQVIPQGGTFAVRAKRAGEHKFTSQDVAREVGSAILDANEKKNLKVNLSNPDIEIFVEVRHNRAFIFSKKIQGPGGFPLGTQGKVLAVISDKKSVYAAWQIAKRGCNTRLLCMDDEACKLTELLKPWHLNSKPFLAEDDSLDSALKLAKRIKAEALVLGYIFEEFENNTRIESDIPVFYPLIGLSGEQINKKITFLFGDGS